MCSATTLRLYLFEGSAAAYTARLELEYKGLAYERVYLPPVFHKFILARRGFEGMSVPALEIDGRRADGTLEISRALDELQPEPPLHPGDPRIEEAERWGEEFQNAARRIFYAALRRRPSAWARMMNLGQSRRVRAAVRLGAPLLVHFAGIYHGGVAAKTRSALEELPASLDRIDGWIREGVLDRDELNAADFEIAPNVRLLLAFEDVAPLIEGTPAAAHARRVVPDFPWRFPALLPRGWFSP